MSPPPREATGTANDAQTSAPTGDHDEVASLRWTALVSGALVVACVLALVLVPVPFVTWAPGRTVNVLGTNDKGKPMISVSGLPNRRSDGQLRLTTVSVTKVGSTLNLVEGLSAYWLPDRDVLPRSAVYPVGRSDQEVRDDEVQMMDTSQRDAVVAALRAAGQPVTEMPMVTAVSMSGAAYNLLRPGDLIEKVDGKAVQSVTDVQRLVRKHSVGDPVSLTVVRNGSRTTVSVITSSSAKDPKVPVIGVSVGTGYRYTPSVSYGIPTDIVGPSAGLILALGIYQTIAPTDLVGTLDVAGTGTIAADGTVSPIGGIQEKIAGAQRDGARIFLVPAGNCRDLAGVDTSMRLVKVDSLKDAISAIQKLRTGADSQEVPQC